MSLQKWGESELPQNNAKALDQDINILGADKIAEYSGIKKKFALYNTCQVLKNWENWGDLNELWLFDRENSIIKKSNLSKEKLLQRAQVFVR